MAENLLCFVWFDIFTLSQFSVFRFFVDVGRHGRFCGLPALAAVCTLEGGCQGRVAPPQAACP